MNLNEILDLTSAENALGSVPNGNHTSANATASSRQQLDEELREAPEAELESLGIRPLWKAVCASEKAPAYLNKKELPQHRVIAYLKAVGMKNIEVARKLGYSQASINYLVRQPFMELLILDEIKKTHDPALQLMMNESFDAAVRTIELSKNAENEQVRLKANESILDRKWGKPNQPMSMRAAKDLSQLPDSELERLILEGQSKPAAN